VLRRFCEESSALSNPRLIRLSGDAEFNATYSIPLETLRRLKCFSGLRRMAKALRLVTPHGKIFLFRDLMNDEFRGEQLGKFLAAMREIIVMNGREAYAALYAPLGYVGPKATDFPLHADLYAPDLLWNIFDQVPRDGSGATKLLPTTVFRKLLYQIRVPEQERNILMSCLDNDTVEDRFRTFYNLLHLNSADWATKLTDKMTAHQFLVTLEYGQGYLINDRKWLHGREAPSGGVTTKRVHRLVFIGYGSGLTNSNGLRGGTQRSQSAAISPRPMRSI
jgi:hypothetical protein